MLNACFVNPSSATKLIWGSTGQGYIRPQPACFLREVFPFLQTTYHAVQLCVEEILHSPSPSFLLSFQTPLNIPPPFPLCAAEWQLVDVACEEFSWRCVVWVCGLHSVERLLTGWMRERKTVYFNLFRMPELCPEFLLNLIP